MNFRDNYREKRGWHLRTMMVAVLLMLAGVGIVVYYDGFPTRSYTGTREVMDIVSLGLVGGGFSLVVIVVLSLIFGRRR